LELEIRKLFRVMEFPFNLQFAMQVVSNIICLPSKIISWYREGIKRFYIGAMVKVCLWDRVLHHTFHAVQNIAAELYMILMFLNLLLSCWEK
jgi:hypothetical protein